MPLLALKPEECSGCRTCELICALHTYQENNPANAALRVRGLFPAPGHYELRTCDQCGDCAKACPTGAIQYGRRDELLTIARQRINDPQGKYVKHIYGETEVGGTSMLYLAAVPFQALGLPALPDVSPAEASQMIMHSTPFVAATVATVLTGLYVITRRLTPSAATVPVHPHAGGN